MHGGFKKIRKWKKNKLFNKIRQLEIRVQSNIKKNERDQKRLDYLETIYKENNKKWDCTDFKMFYIECDTIDDDIKERNNWNSEALLKISKLSNKQFKKQFKDYDYRRI